MVKLTNNWIIVDDENLYLPLKIALTKPQPPKTIKLKNGKKITKTFPDYNYFEEYDNNILYIPIGMLSFLSEYFQNTDIIDERIDNTWINDDMSIEEISHILCGIELRGEQAVAVRKALSAKRGILQLPTGSGKTEVMCAIVECIKKSTGEYPTVLILEPTIYLVNSTVKRFKKYYIPAQSYTETREISLHTVNICHPSALGNDIEKNPDLLNQIQILIGDESHHLCADQFRKPIYSMNNLSMSIGVSASVITQQHINVKRIQEYDIKEALAIGATGPLLMNVVTSSMVDKNLLATPVLFTMKHLANEPLPKNDVTNWNNVKKIQLESDRRNELIVQSANVFSKYDRKSLILVNTIRWARLLLEKFYEIGLGDIVGASYGGGKFEYYDGNNFIRDDNISTDFANGNKKILIGTTHLYEGADIPNLDTIILAFGGKGERTQIQGIGRALRLTKTGKYAYIVDFTDDFSPVLSSHFRSRLKRYKDIIGIPADRIYYNCSVEKLENEFINLENIE